jgi:ATP-dependent Clp protease ATP-binding subunit ClpA
MSQHCARRGPDSTSSKRAAALPAGYAAKVVADRFDKFSQRARRALKTAQEESARLGHAEIGAEHLLVGLARERSGVAWLALVRMGANLEDLDSAALALAGTSQAPVQAGGLSASARQTIELAVDEARRQQHLYVGTEHLLLGLLRTDSAAARLLNERGITLLGARAAIVGVLNQSPPARATSAPRSRLIDRLDLGARFADDALDVCLFAEDEARRMNHNYLGTEHLLLGLTREPGGEAGRALLAQGVDLSRVRLSVESIIGRGDRRVGSTVGFTPRATRALDLASEEAARDGLPRAGSEHVLRGLIREGEGVAAGVLQSLGVDVPGLMTLLHGSAPSGPSPTGVPALLERAQVAPRRWRRRA